MVRSFLLICLCCYSLEAAAPATHVIIANKWMDRAEPESREAFVAGTLFPDIRYLGTISRKKTHKKGITPQKIRRAPSPFIGGMWLHAWVDEEREDFIKKYGVLKQLKAIPKKLRVLFLKLLEDEILWDNGEWVQVQDALKVIYPESISIGVEEQIVDQWNQTMIDYFNQRPIAFLILHSMADQGFLKADAATIREWCHLLPLYAQDLYFIEYVHAMVDDLVGRMTDTSEF